MAELMQEKKKLFSELLNYLNKKEKDSCIIVFKNKIILLDENSTYVSERNFSEKNEPVWSYDIPLPIDDLKDFRLYFKENNDDDNDYDDDEDDNDDDDSNNYNDDKDDDNNLNSNFSKLNIQPKTKSWAAPDQIKMCRDVVQGINDIRTYRNIQMEFSLKVQWIDDEESRKSALKELYENTVSKRGNTNLPSIYMNLKKLSNWKVLYNEREKESEFTNIINAIDPVNKTNKKIKRFDDLFVNLPDGTYGSCTIPISFLRLIKDENWKLYVLDKLSGVGSSEVEN